MYSIKKGANSWFQISQVITRVEYSNQ